MKRRTALKLLSGSSIGLAGCIANGAAPGSSSSARSSNQDTSTGETNSTTSGNTTTGDTRYQNDPRSIEITDVNKAPDSVGLSFSIKPVIDTVTSNHTPQIKISIENKTDKTTRLNSGEPFAYSTTNGSGLILLQKDTVQAPDCRNSNNISFSADIVGQSIKGNTSVSTIYTLVNDPSSRGCFEVGTYPFSPTYTIGELNGGKSKQGKQFTLKFSVKIKNE